MSTPVSPFDPPRTMEGAPGAGPRKDPWNPRAIGAISFCFSFLPAGIMYALNFERLGAPEKKRGALIAVLIGFAAFIALIVLLPDNAVTNRMFMPLNMGIAYGLYHSQKDAFDRHLARGGKAASVKMPVILSIAGLIVAAAGIFGYVWVVGDREQAEFARGAELMNQEKWTEAEPIFVSYRESNPDEPATYWNLAQIYLHTDRPREAKKAVDQLLKVDPKFENAGQLQQLIEERLQAPGSK